MGATVREQADLVALRRRIEELRTFLTTNTVPDPESDIGSWYAYLRVIKGITGNASNDMSFVATVMAREYLSRTLPMRPFDANTKAQGAPGLDIDEQTQDGERVIGEIKTTTPYGTNDFGANQIATLKKDFAKLRDALAPHKFFFVTEKAAFDIVMRRYMAHLEDVKIVLLPSTERPLSPSPEVTPTVVYTGRRDETKGPAADTGTGRTCPVGAKYQPLAAYLGRVDADNTMLTFNDIEDILCSDLPLTARTHPAWWANTAEGHTHARAWLNLGWKTCALSLPQQRVTFIRSS